MSREGAPAVEGMGARPRVVMPLRRGVSAFSPEDASLDQGAALFAKLVFAATLPLFAQVFYYLNEYPPPYLLSKAWPFLTLPMAFYAMARLKLPVSGMFLTVLAYALGFTPLVSMIQLGNGFLDALTTTIKAWPFTYYFSLSALLALLAVPARSIRKIVLALGLATFILMVLIYLAAPTSWYSDNPADGKLLLYDLERSYRVYMPMFFGMILVFFLARSFILQRNILFALVVVLAFVPMLLIFKQRTAIAAAAVVVVFGMTMSLPPALRRLVIGGALLGGAAGVALLAYKLGLFSSGSLEGAKDALGASLSVRQNSSSLAFAFLGDDPMRWTFGVGATTRFSTTTLNDIFGNEQFFIADLGWIGVIFEYGVIGAALLAVLYAWCFVYVFRLTRDLTDAFTLALADYVLFLIVSSAVYSVVFTPGELGVVMALIVHLDRQRRVEPPPLPQDAPPTHRISRPLGPRHANRQVALGQAAPGGIALGRVTLARASAPKRPD
ncbi:hypothetical protein ABLE93_11780 [Xanthobacter sp. KR7-65]|uniref:hypothetical protein n=1 Tax=Xanthobacter sp. KR7-65 TaxID=3156612 RepID=UPI0032B4534D